MQRDVILRKFSIRGAFFFSFFLSKTSRLSVGGGCSIIAGDRSDVTPPSLHAIMCSKVRTAGINFTVWQTINLDFVFPSEVYAIAVLD